MINSISKLSTDFTNFQCSFNYIKYKQNSNRSGITLRFLFENLGILGVTKKTKQAFAKHIDKLRRSRGLSFQAMANACEVDKAQIYVLCTDGADVRMSTIIKLSKGLQIPIEEIFDFKY